ncbi:MAG: DUF255 domain-containing protein [Candidatus Latescibacteria bacterium]|jgi:thioredoxin-related protein|nr:DUF255 domain-containing protein [Candidatus Latescibacterota bacterium]
MTRIGKYLSTLCLMTVLWIGAPTILSASDPDRASGNEPTWHRYDKALKLAQDQDKFLLIDFYTDWCGWCEVMDEKTYTDPEVRKLIDEHFILVKVNAESKRFIKLQGRNITETRLASIYKVTSYPTTWFLQSDGKAIAPVNGYVTPQDFEPILRYISGGWFKKMGYDAFVKQAR